MNRKPRRLARKRLNPVGFSEGARLLWVAILERHLTFLAAGDLAGLAEGTINRIVYGDRKPGRDAALTLKRLFAIPLEAWSLRPAEPFEVPERLSA